MASVEIVDETVVLADRLAVAAVLSDRARWLVWWPDLDVTLVRDGGIDGIQWSVAGPLVGTSEVVLVPQGPAVLVRYSLRADPTAPGSRTTTRQVPDSPHGRRELGSLQRRHLLAWKRVVWAMTDQIEKTS